MMIDKVSYPEVNGSHNWRHLSNSSSSSTVCSRPLSKTIEHVFEFENSRPRCESKISKKLKGGWYEYCSCHSYSTSVLARTTFQYISENATLSTFHNNVVVECGKWRVDAQHFIQFSYLQNPCTIIAISNLRRLWLFRKVAHVCASSSFLDSQYKNWETYANTIID